MRFSPPETETPAMNHLKPLCITLLFVGVCASLVQADSADDIETLQAVHDRTLQQLRKQLTGRAPGDGQYRLTLAGGTEGNDAKLTLIRVGDDAFGWVVVPWWRQETQKEKFSFRHRDGRLSMHRDKFRYAVDTPDGQDALSIEDGRLVGELVVDYRLDLPRRRRMPPGGRHMYTTDGRWSLVDRWYVGPRVTLRRQTCRLKAKVRPKLRRVELVLEGGIDGRPLHLTATAGGGAWGDARVKAPNWNAGVHQADANGLRFDDGRLTGTLKVRFNPDAWFPKQVWYATYELDVAVDGGRADGSFNASIAEGSYAEVTGQNKSGTRPNRKGPAGFEGRVTGTVLPAVVGRYETTGPLGTRQGRIIGGVLPVCRRPGKLLVKPADTPAARATTLYNQTRAMRSLLGQYDRSLAEALAASDVPAPVWDKPDPAGEAAYVKHLARIASTAGGKPAKAPIKGRPAAKNPRFGPYYGTAPLPDENKATAELSAVRSGGPQKWEHLTGWRVLGPMPAPPAFQRPVIDMPALVPAEGAGRPIDTDTLGRSYRGPKLITWQSVETQSDGKLLPPPWTWGKKGLQKTPGRENSSWYAEATINSEKAQEVYLAVDAHDHALLWVNDRLAWIDAERQRNYRTHRPAVFKVHLKKGPNRLLLRVRDDRAEAFVKVSVCTAGTNNAGKAPSPETPMIKTKASLPEPPLAWDLAKGKNIDWTREVEGATGQPVLAGDRIFLAAKPHDLVCLDAKTGKQLWRGSANVLERIDAKAAKAFEQADETQRRELIEKHLGKRFVRGKPDTPVVDADNVYLHVGTGVLACFDTDGKRRWMLRTHMADAVLTVAGGKLVVEGAAVDGWADIFGVKAEGFTGKTQVRAGHNYGKSVNHTLRRLERLRSGEHHGLLAVTGEGKVAYARAAAGRFAGSPMVLSLHDPDGQRKDVLVTRSAEAWDAATGKRLRDLIDLGTWDWLSATTDGRRLLSAWEGGRAGAVFWLDSGGLGYRKLWDATRLHAYVAGGPHDGCTDGRTYWVWRRVGEHAKHCPAYRLQLDAFDVATGRRLGWIKPAVSGTNRAVQPVRIGGYLYLADTRGGPHSGGTPPERQVVVTTAERQPVLVSRNHTPNVSGPPVRHGRGLILRCGGKLVRVAVDGDRGGAWQEDTVARHVFERIYGDPPERSARCPNPLKEGPGRDLPVMELTDGGSLSDWLVAGPFPVSVTATPQADFLPRNGETLTLGGESAKLDPLPDALISQSTSFHNDGRLDDWQVRRTIRRVDLNALGDRGEGVYYLAAVVANPQRRLVYSAMDAAGLTVYLAGSEIDAGQPLDLEAGLYPLVIRVDPTKFRRRRRRSPIDVAGALKSDDVKSVGWPEKWSVFGPIPEAGGSPEPQQLTSIPETLKLGQNEYRRIALPTIGHSLDLTAIAALEEGQKPTVTDKVQSRPVKQQQSAWAMAEVNVPADGTLVVNAAADWFMEWYVDGKRVYSTLSKGNMRAPTQLEAHTFSASVSKGKHVVAVRVKPGSKGWSVTSLGALATTDSASLAKKHPGKGVRAKESEWRVNLTFHQLAHPAAVAAVRARQIRRAKELLRRIVNRRSGTEQANRAGKLLKTLGRGTE
jgi:outer membrane protein assembly factor BamB